MGSRTETAGQRLKIFEALTAHNRRISILRYGVPALGLFVFALLAGQLYISNLSKQFGIAGLTIDRTKAMVESPRYSGIMPDGTSYLVTAGEARAALSATNLIDLSDARIVFTNPDLSQTTATTQAATLDSNTQQVDIAGEGDVLTSDGTRGIFTRTLIDWPAQTFDINGGVKLDFADGTTLDSQSAVYDMGKGIWSFQGVTVTMPSTPGESLGAAAVAKPDDPADEPTAGPDTQGATQ
jgi:lipopolysaccharide export system protein LptC